ncbi:MAG: hypothetical protein HEP71_29665 [Roseivirga sp.]|nr:hypothetical protein [Roseivirga sp.]
MNSLVSLSTYESQLLGLRIGRLSTSKIDASLLKEVLEKDQYDVLKVNVDANDPELYYKLNSLQRPFFILSMLQEYRVNVKRLKIKPLLHTNAVIAPLCDENEPELLRLVQDCFAEIPGSYFLNPGLEDYYNPRKQAALLARYIANFRPERQAGHYCHLLRYKGCYVGFMAHTYIEGTGYAHYAGVDPDTRQPGFYVDLMRFVQNFAIGQRINWGYTSAQIQNTVAHKVYVREDMVPYRAMLNIHINNF